MELGELALILLVMVLVFKPKDLPRLARFIAKLHQQIKKMIAAGSDFIEQQERYLQLEDNERRAAEAEQLKEETSE